MKKNKFWYKLIIQTVAILVTAAFFDGIIVTNIFSAIIAALILGFLNTLLRPILILLTIPLTVTSLGLWIFCINAIILKLTAALIPGFMVHGFFTAIFGSLFISIVSLAINTLTIEDKSITTIDLKQSRKNFWE